MDDRNSVKNNIAAAIAFCIFLAVVPLFLIFLPDKDFSGAEKRVLSQRPELSLGSALDGSFESDVEKYIQDQIPLRNAFVGIGSYFDRLIGKNGADGIISGKDGYLFNTPVVFNKDSLDINLSLLNNFSDNVKTDNYIMIVPSAGYMLEDKLPAVHETYRDKEILDYISDSVLGKYAFVDITDALSRSSETNQIFYRTDHHWTSAGAYAAYREFAGHAGYDALSEDMFVKEYIDGFHGTTYSKSALWFKKPDRMELWTYPESDITVKITDIGSEKTTTSDSLFFKDGLEKYDMYPVYLDGNHSLTEITNDSVKDGTLLIIKDSYANTLATLLADSFHRVLMVDLRYYRTESVSGLIEEYGVDKLLVLYGIDNIINDTNLIWLK
ncbi:MAG: hypothetical protein K6F09_02410 [Clostridiales bacterium]|nr:hypothetical protein [Clostridiales bacterium]